MSHARSPRLSRRAIRTLESLEPRRLMAIFTVNSYDDILTPPAGTVTLRSAIQAANTSPGPNTINLPYAGTYKLTTVSAATDNSAGELAIADSGDLTIQNTSGGTVTIKGNGLNRVFDVDPAGSAMPFTVTFGGLNITGGLLYAGNGGGIDVHGAANVTLNQGHLAGNAASGYGGGIAMEGGSTGSLAVNGTQIAGNTTYTGGGGIAAFGTGNVAIGPQSLITENSTEGSSGGGGILVHGSPLNVTGAVISNNRSLTINGGTPGPGGGIVNAGTGAASISGSIIEDNSAAANGGGYADTGLASLTVLTSFFLDNTAGASGGGIAAGGPLISIARTSFAGNTSLDTRANSGGGGLYLSGTGTSRLTDSTIDGNTSIVYGGGIDDQAAKLIVTGTTLADNRSLFENGGGLYMSVTTGDLTISNSLFRDNAAGFEGGGISTTGGTLEVAASRFTGNAAVSGGAAYLGGAVFSISGSTFDANRTSGGSGALYLSLSPGDSLTNSTIVANASGGQGAISLFGLGTGTLAMIDDTIDGNTNASASGGGIYQAIGTLTVQGTIIAGNTAAGAPADYLYAGGTLTDKGGNLLGTTAGTGAKFGATTIFADPRLALLLDNGGPHAGAPSSSQVVPTQALLPGSPAFGAGVATGGPALDERNFPRPTKPSIGAYEPQYAANATPNQIFVENLYEVLLGRVGDAASAAYAVNFLNNGGSGVSVVQGMQSSMEFRLDEATSLYHRYLGRSPSAADQTNLANYLASATPEQAAANFLGTTEFSQDYGSNDGTFVEAVYQDALGRAAAPSERDGWVQLLASGGTRTGVATLFVTSPGYLDQLLAADYPAYLGRTPSPAEAANLAKLWPGLTSLQIEAVLLGYGEALARRT